MVPLISLRVIFVFNLVVGIIIANEPVVEIIGKPFVIIDDAGSISGKVSPDGNYLAYTKTNYKGLYLFNMKDGTIQTVSSEPASGYGFRWSHKNDIIVYKSASYVNKKRYNSVKIYDVAKHQYKNLISDRINLTGIPKWNEDDASVYLDLGSEPLVFQIEATRTARRFTVAMGNTIQELKTPGMSTEQIISRDKDILALEINSLKNKIVFKEYGGHLFIFDMNNGNIVDIGIGNEPVWSPDGEKLAFMTTADDGYVLTESNIFVVRENGTGLVNITEDFPSLAMRPSWTPDSKYLVFDTDGLNGIFMQEIR